jgi:hypothetical protein
MSSNGPAGEDALELKIDNDAAAAAEDFALPSICAMNSLRSDKMALKYHKHESFSISFAITLMAFMALPGWKESDREWKQWA